MGLGVSGAAAAELLLAEGAGVSAWDRAPSGSLGGAELFVRRGVELFPSGEDPGPLDRFSLVVLSPGIPPSHPLVRAALSAGVTVIGELELGFLYCRRPVIAVTGTNGKTTTVSLIGRMLAAGGVAAEVGGNIGIPLCRLALEPKPAAAVVAEVSSFQLESIVSFRPRISVFLNFSPDHLDRYPRLEDYRRAKLKIFANQGRGDRAVLPPSPPAWLEEAVRRQVKVTAWNRPGSRVFAEGGTLFARRGRERVILASPGRIRLAGSHNLENIMAAALVALEWGAAPEAIARAVEEFEPLAHRLEPVGSGAGVDYYNDSKATNPRAALAALRSFSRPVIWIAGGSDKGFDFSGLAAAVPKNVKKAILLGETAPLLARELKGGIPFSFAPNLVRAVELARAAAEEGDVVLLSPACASFDQFKDYRHRGEVFRESVSRVAGTVSPCRRAGQRVNE